MVSVCVALTLAACSPEAPRPAPDVVVSDSAGVTVVRVPPLSTFEVAEWSTRRLTSIEDLEGGGPDLYQVEDALFLGDSALVIANVGVPELIWVDLRRRTYIRVGRQGDGPGEFRDLLHRLLPHPSGDVLAFDGRFSRFDPAGGFIETRRLEGGGRTFALDPLAVFGDGTAVSVTWFQNNFRDRGELRDTVPLLLHRPGVLVPDTIATWLGFERAFYKLPGSQLLVPIGFARTVFAASNGRRFAIGSTDSLDITVYDERITPALRLVAAAETRAPSRNEADRWREDLLEDMPMETEEIRQAWSDGPIRDRYPGFDGLAVDDAGRVWVGDYPELDARSRRWVVFSRDGTPAGQIHLPLLGFRRIPGDTELLAVGRNRLALLRTNALDEEFVEVWTFSEEGS